MQIAVNEINKRYEDANISDIPFNDTITRYGDKKHVWTVGHSWVYKSNEYLQVIYGSWRDGSTFKVNSWDEKDADKKFKSFARKKTSEINAKIELEQKIKYKDCREKWEPIFGMAVKDNHEYLSYKKIEPYNTKVDSKGILLVPCYNEKGFTGVQRIYKNPETQKFEKRFAFGIEIKASFSPLKPIQGATLIYLSEGYATAATIQKAFPDFPSVCAFNAGNLGNAIRSIRLINENCKIVIAADRDLNRVGQKKAAQCIKLFSNVIYKLPQFQDKNDSWTDYNDLHCFESLEKVQEQLKVDYSDFNDVIALGHKDNVYYYFSTDKKTLFPLTPNKHNKAQLLLIAPAAFWAGKYACKFDDDDNPTDKPAWDGVIEKLGEESGRKGFFTSDSIRGQGCWQDKGTLVYNDGENIHQGGKRTANFNFKSKFFYESSKKIPDLPEPATVEECKQIAEAFSMINFKNKGDYIYVIGWLVQAQIFGALDWRPTLWITGPKGTGKTTILKYINKIVGHSLLIKDSTRAGVVQNLQNDAKAIIYDESEPDSDKITQIIEVARQASTLTESKILRGTQHGQSISYNTNTCFCFGSIRQPNFNSADASRIFSIEMETLKDQTWEQWQKLEKYLENAALLGPKLMSRMINGYDLFRKTIMTAKMTCQEIGIESRQADQLSSVIAGYYFLVFPDSEPITSDHVKTILKIMNYSDSEYKSENMNSDESDCLDTLMDIRLDNEGMTVAYAINLMVQNVRKRNDDANSFLEKKLLLFGIAYNGNNKVFVASKNAYLSAEMSKLAGFDNYAKLLRRTDNFIENHQKRMVDGKNKKGLLLSI